MLATDMLGHLALQKCCCTVLVAYAQGYPNTHNLYMINHILYCNMTIYYGLTSLFLSSEFLCNWNTPLKNILFLFRISSSIR